MFVSSGRIEWYIIWPKNIKSWLDLRWPQVKVTKWPRWVMLHTHTMRNDETNTLTPVSCMYLNSSKSYGQRYIFTLSRARPVVLAKHERPGGGGDFRPPPKISKTKQRRDMRQTALDRPSSEYKTLLRWFFSGQNLAPRGQKCQNFPRFCFANNTVVFNVSAKIMAPSCSPRRDKSNDVYLT